MLSHPRDGHLARHRPVAGVLLDAVLAGHELFKGLMPVCKPSMACTWYARTCLKSQKAALPTQAQKTRATCARELNNSTTNVMLFKQRLVTRLVLPLDVVEKRAARCDHFQ